MDDIKNDRFGIIKSPKAAIDGIAWLNIIFSSYSIVVFAVMAVAAMVALGQGTAEGVDAELVESESIIVVLVYLSMSLLMFVSAIGLLKRKAWGRRIVVVVLSLQVFATVIECLVGLFGGFHWVMLISLCFSLLYLGLYGGMLYALLCEGVRREFGKSVESLG